MNNLSIRLSCVSCAMMLAAAASSAADLAPQQRSLFSDITVSTGHNLKSIKQNAAAETLVRRMKTPPPTSTGKSLRKAPAATKGLNAHKARRGANIIDETSAALFESFESCTLFADDMPAGWTIQSKGEKDLGTEDHWIGFSKAYSDAYMFAPPADGSMMVGVFYNDDYFKDEWLISPELTIPSDGYELSFYWYTVPYYIYVIDRFHVDFEEKLFIDREILFNVEVLAKTTDSDEWTVVFDLEKQFADLEYSDLEVLAYDEMQKAVANLDSFAGKTVQIAFRYFGEAGNTFLLDAVRVDRPLPEVSFEPDYSRLFFGFSPDEDLWWAEASIEFYPVNHEVTWHNTSNDLRNCEFNWAYSALNDEGELVWMNDDSRDELCVTYHPDYTSQSTLINNLYYLPKLKARNAAGAISDYVSGNSDFLQAGGTTELAAGSNITKYTATNFDIINEGFGVHFEEDEELGFIFEPVFGYSVNTDAWWEHYCFPNGKQDGQYAYVDGFLNMYLPHPTAPLVVNGISAVALGTITDQARFTLKIYSMTEFGEVVETPIVTKSILGSEVIKLSGFSTRDYLVMNFNLDTPVIFDTEGTGYGYLVEISGYRDPQNVEYFCPLQSTIPNEYEWTLGFYHIYRSGHEDDLTNQISYVCFFTDDFGRDLYTSFAIGLDAHYPWLEIADSADPFTKADGEVRFALKGYYDAAQYTVDAPEGVNVALDGRYITEVTVTADDTCTLTSAPITFTAPGVSLTVEVPVEHSGIGSVAADSDTNADIYNAQGVLIHRAATDADLRALPAGLYIHGGRKVLVK